MTTGIESKGSFTPTALARKIRMLLDAPPPVAAAEPAGNLSPVS